MKTVEEYKQNNFPVIPCYANNRKPIGKEWEEGKHDFEPGNNIGLHLLEHVDALAVNHGGVLDLFAPCPEILLLGGTMSQRPVAIVFRPLRCHMLCSLIETIHKQLDEVVVGEVFVHGVNLVAGLAAMKLDLLQRYGKAF